MKNYALVTGASKGIGRAIAENLAKRNYDLLLVARSENELVKLKDSLESKYQISVETFAIDLSEQGAALSVYEWIVISDYNVSILVNNAGYGLWGKFEVLPLAQQMNMLQLNVNTVVELTYYILPFLKKQNKSFILNVSSTAAYQAVPTLALYSASKSFVLSFTRALRFELKRTCVSATCLCPGPVDTGFAARAGLNSLSKLAQKFNMKPDEVAEIALNGMFHEKSEVIPGITNIISAYANRFLSKSFIEKTAASIYEV
ncbi:MAG: short-chain dehydrogenase/reductase [Sphingobacteriales bacterium]|nr:short-chain dehydrogenase/reductase [Sphingobacteriales bacterium]